MMRAAWLCALLALPVAAKVQVFLLLGDSNTAGRGDVDHLEELVDRGEYRFLRTRSGSGFQTNSDVRITFNQQGLRSRDLEVGFGLQGAGPDDTNVFGVDIGFGWSLAESVEDPILIVKVAERGASLGREWLAPRFQNPNDDDSGRGWNDLRFIMGDVEDRLDSYVPGNNQDGFEIAGAVVFMGWNDAFDNSLRNSYFTNLQNFIGALMDTYGANLPIIVAELGQQGTPARDGNVEQVRRDQENVAHFFREGQGRRNVDFLSTSQFLESGRQFHNEAHFFGRADTFMDIGIAFAEKMVDLIDVQSTRRPVAGSFLVPTRSPLMTPTLPPASPPTTMPFAPLQVPTKIIVPTPAPQMAPPKGMSCADFNQDCESNGDCCSDLICYKAASQTSSDGSCRSRTVGNMSRSSLSVGRGGASGQNM